MAKEKIGFGIGESSGVIRDRTGKEIGNYSGGPILGRTGKSDVWEAFFELTDLDGNYDLENLLKERLSDEDKKILHFDSESSWFVVVIKDRSKAQEICDKANKILKEVLVESIMD